MCSLSLRSEPMDLSVYERVTSNGYLGDVRGRGLDDIRALRTECQRLEANLSYLRRLVQGRLDIVADATTRALAGQPVGGSADLVASLPTSLGDHLVSSTSGRLTDTIGPGPDPTITVELDAICNTEQLGALGRTAVSDLVVMRNRLIELEREVSQRRRAVFDRLDALSGEIARRYRDGETSVDTLLD